MPSDGVGSADPVFRCAGCDDTFDGRPAQIVDVFDNIETYCGECSEVNRGA